ncbi:MAG: hypothetical protein PHI11_06855 [Gallionella sp.]|nr:hypothetical protein [Gallionella sp.]
MKLKSNDIGDALIGCGIGGILVLIIVVGVERFNGPPPSINSLLPFSGQLVDKHISRDRDRIFADIQVRNGTQSVILFQQVSEKLSVEIQSLQLGKTVAALIVPKEFMDSRTGLIRHSMWQLAINEQTVFSYNEITQFINNKTALWRKFGYWTGAFGLACFIAAGLMRLRHVLH